MALILLLDITFDTNDHDLFIRRLEETLGLISDVKKWVPSYLSNRLQKAVKVGSKLPNLANAFLRGTPGIRYGSTSVHSRYK